MHTILSCLVPSLRYPGELETVTVGSVWRPLPEIQSGVVTEIVNTTTGYGEVICINFSDGSIYEILRSECPGVFFSAPEADPDFADIPTTPANAESDPGPWKS